LDEAETLQRGIVPLSPLLKTVATM
jgi:hypothetical protein